MSGINFTKSNTLEDYLRLIQMRIIQSVEIQNYQSPYDQPDDLLEFKGFITAYLSGCIFLVKVKKYYGVNDFKNDDPIYRKIFRAIASIVVPFYQHYVRNDRLVIGLFDNSLFKDDAGVILDIFSRLGTYQKEILESYATGNPYFFEEWEEPEYDDEIGMTLTGEKIYFEYIRLLFLSKLEKEDSQNKVATFDVWELDESQYDNLTAFVKTVCKIGNEVEIQPELLAL